MDHAGSVEAVVAAIREDVRAELDRIQRETETAIARAREEDAAMPVVVADADARIRDARRQARERASADDWADRQSALGAREAWTRAVAEGAMRQLRDRSDADRRSDLLQLAREALERLGGADCELLVAPGDAALVDAEVRRSLQDATGKRVTVTPSDAVDGGCIAQTADRRIRFDNTWSARARRFEPMWRQALGQLFNRLAVVHA